MNYENVEDKIALQQIETVRPLLIRLCNLMSLAETAKDKSEAVMFIAVLSEADRQVMEAFGDRGASKDVAKWIREGHGDFAKLRDLYIQLGAV